MRDLIILRGCPGAGKSTWIKENGLEQYTLSPDNIRNMVCAPMLTSDKMNLSISQSNDNYVWSLLYELLEKRMQNGDFTIIDATHSKSSDFSRYNSLCETYRYRKYFVSFTDVPIETCKERNRTREEFKRVPEEVIDKMYSRFQTQEKTSGWKEIKKEEFWNTFENKLFDFNNYKKIHIIGDIHGCFEPLKKYILSQTFTEQQNNITPENLSQFLNDEDFYLFVGDYTDRGIQNKEVLEFIYNICNFKNVLLLEGNHEIWPYYYATDQYEKIKSKEFLENTKEQIADIEPSKLRQIYRKLGQMAYFTFKGQDYFVTHAGLNRLPENLHLISTNQFIKGVGKWETDIDKIFTENSNIIQIHGHRNPNYEDSDTELSSYSLEDRVEFGGNLRVLILEDDNIYMSKIKNDLFREKVNTLDNEKPKELTEENLVEVLRNNEHIRESILDNNISSFNFTRDAFENKIWNKETVKARGLFIDTSIDKIVARGYEKFFNINERETTKLFNLKYLFETNEPVIAYQKYNGFLGILSYYHGDLQFHSKSSNCGDYSNYFKNLFYKQFNTLQVEYFKDYLKQNNVSLTFEVIDLENDPHIIEEPKSKVVLLDIIHNQVEFKKESYSDLVEFARKGGISEEFYKQIYTEISTYRDLIELFEKHKDETNMDDTNIEGVVIESGSFMTKLKFNYYHFWKHMRSVSETVLYGRRVRTGSLLNETSNLFYKFVKDKYERDEVVLKSIKDIISDNSIKLQTIKKLKTEGPYIIINVPIKNKLFKRVRFIFNTLTGNDNSIINYKEKRIYIGDDLSKKLNKIQSRKTDIITLRKEFLGGK